MVFGTFGGGDSFAIHDTFTLADSF